MERLWLATAPASTPSVATPSAGTQHAEAYRYDPAANTWTALAPIATGPDYLFHAEYGSNGKIYVMGGNDGGAGSTLNRIYDIAHQHLVRRSASARRRL